jgi:hypothetical protein
MDSKRGRLESMATIDGQWDLSPNDIAAIRWGLQRSEAADRLKEACEALLCATFGWADNGEQLTHAAQLARDAIAFANRTKMEVSSSETHG